VYFHGVHFNTIKRGLSDSYAVRFLKRIFAEHRHNECESFRVIQLLEREMVRDK
jgi:hypothetical protein